MCQAYVHITRTSGRKFLTTACLQHVLGLSFMIAQCYMYIHLKCIDSNSLTHLSHLSFLTIIHLSSSTSHHPPLIIHLSPTSHPPTIIYPSVTHLSSLTLTIIHLSSSTSHPPLIIHTLPTSLISHPSPSCSAVDSHVGKHICKKVIGPEGILSGKVRDDLRV